jgi:hypothetical protein
LTPSESAVFPWAAFLFEPLGAASPLKASTTAADDDEEEPATSLGAFTDFLFLFCEEAGNGLGTLITARASPV